MKILVVDDDTALCRSLDIHLSLKGHKVRCAHTVATGLDEARAFEPEVVFLDLNLPDQWGLRALPTLIALPDEPTVLVMTGESDNTAAVEAMRNGAFDYLCKPLDHDDIFSTLERVSRHRNQKPAEKAEEDAGHEISRSLMIGGHPEIIELHKKIGLLSRSRVTVLVCGESGTGKELAARILHEAGAPGKPFVAINCSAVVPTLLESEFFGHEKGAFTGADRQKIGKLEYAKDGTVFLDEIGDMPLDLQGKILRVLQEEEFVRVGGLEPIRLRARMVAATHWDLRKLVDEGRFRKDLYYRLSVSTLHLPPLRERLEDIPLLVDALLTKITNKLHSRRPTVTEGAMQRLMAYDWPGNVRELENVLTRCVAMAIDTVITVEDLRLLMSPPQERAICGVEVKGENEPVTLAEAEKRHVERVLTAMRWNITQSAKRLAISPTTLRKKIADYNIVNPFG